MEFTTTANRRKYEISVRQGKFEWSNKVREGILDILVTYKKGRYTEIAIVLAEKQIDGSFKMKARKGTSALNKNSLEILLANIKEEIEKEENAEAIEKILNQ